MYIIIIMTGMIAKATERVDKANYFFGALSGHGKSHRSGLWYGESEKVITRT